MAFTTIVTQGPSPEEDYGLDAVAKHNAASEQFAPYQEGAKGLGIYRDEIDQQYHEDGAYLQNPPTPRSTTASEGVRTRSGRSTRGRTDSPFAGTNDRASNSPAPSRKRKKKSKVDKADTPRLPAPLSILTKDMEVPCKDMHAWVHRSAETRRREVEKRQGYVTRPMNSFMLYRSAYAERTKAWCEQNNHQVVSSVAGESWPKEPEEVRNQFNEWAKIERANHHAAHPEYKFSPSKSTKKRKGEFSDDEEDGIDVGRDPDGEYRGGSGGRRVRHRGQQYHQPVEYPVGPVCFDSNPYYNQQVAYEASHYYNHPGPVVRSNAAVDQYGNAHDPQTGRMIHTGHQQHFQHHNPYVDNYGFRVATPASMNGAQSIGAIGLPGSQNLTDEGFVFGSRTSTPMQQQYYHQYNQPIYPQYHQQTPTPQHYAAYQPPAPSQQQMYEHQQYLHQASQPQEAVDPTLSDFAAAGGNGPSQEHFVDAMGEMGGDLGYLEESTSPNQTLAPASSWEPGGELVM